MEEFDEMNASIARAREIRTKMQPIEHAALVEELMVIMINTLDLEKARGLVTEDFQFHFSNQDKENII